MDISCPYISEGSGTEDQSSEVQLAYVSGSIAFQRWGKIMKCILIQYQLRLSCDSNVGSELQWWIPKGWSGWCLDWRDLALTYVLHPSNLLVPNFILEVLEVSEYIRMSAKMIVNLSEGQKYCREDTKSELDSIFKLANVTKCCSYLWSLKVIVWWNRWKVGTKGWKQKTIGMGSWVYK